MSLRAEPTRDPFGAPQSNPSDAGELPVLPLRLSVDRGALSIELTRPYVTSGISVEALEVLLEGAPFPVDLSRGVKQFRNRRGALRRLQVRLDLDVFGRHMLSAASDVLGEPALGVRILPTALTEAPQADHLEQRRQADNDARAPTLGMLAVSLFGARRALAFDLVLAPGSPPSFVVDAARGLSLEKPALALVLSLFDRALALSPFGFVRKGRTIELDGLARAVLNEIFPGLGFRAPRIGGHVVHRAFFGREGVSLAISTDDEPCPVGARAIRLAGLASFTRSADDRLAGFDLEGARAELLEVAERVPGHAEVLLNLADIDASDALRAESALAFLEEARRAPGDLGSRTGLIAHRALARGLRRDLSLEALEQTLEIEADGTIAALCHCAVAVASADTNRAIEQLDRAVSRAPSHPQPRWLRLEWNLRSGSWSKGLVDAQQLEATAPPGPLRGAVARRVGALFAKYGQLDQAIIWLRRALVSSPDDPNVLLELARALESSGEGLRAAELYQMALARAEGETLETGELEAARLALGRLLASETGDIALALGYLRRVGSRAKEAMSARELEIRLARQAGDPGALRSATLRLIQGLELGWIVSDRAAVVLSEVEASLRELGHEDLADHAARTLRGLAPA